MLASILVLTGIKLLNLPRVFRQLVREPLQASVWLVTVLGILFSGLLNGLVIGLAYALCTEIGKTVIKRPHPG